MNGILQYFRYTAVLNGIYLPIMLILLNIKYWSTDNYSIIFKILGS